MSHEDMIVPNQRVQMYLQDSADGEFGIFS